MTILNKILNCTMKEKMITLIYWIPSLCQTLWSIICVLYWTSSVPYWILLVLLSSSHKLLVLHQLSQLFSKDWFTSLLLWPTTSAQICMVPASWSWLEASPTFGCPCKARLTSSMFCISRFSCYFQTWMKCTAQVGESSFLGSCPKSQMQQSRCVGY